MVSANDESESLIDPFAVEKTGNYYRIDNFSNGNPGVPIITGPAEISLSTGDSFPLAQYQGHTSNGTTLAVSIVSPYRPEVAGHQLVTLQAVNPTTNKKSYMLVSVNVKERIVYQKNIIQFNGRNISYQNGGTTSGKQIIDGNHQMASTYFGGTFSPYDNNYTHFIAHNPGVGQNFMTLQNNSEVTVSDGSGNARTYHVYKIVDVPMTLDANGYDTPTTDWGQDIVDELYYGDIEDEEVVFQTCVKPDATLVRFIYAR